MKKERFTVTGMTCSACSARVEKSVSKLSGAEQVAVNLLSNSMTVEYDENKLKQEMIIRAVEESGYGIVPIGTQPVSKRPDSTRLSQNDTGQMKKRLIVSLIFSIPLFYISMGHMLKWPLPGIFVGSENALIFAFTQFLLLLPVIFVNKKYYETGFKTLFHRAPNMDSLIAIGSAAAVIYGIFAIYKIGYGLGHDDIKMVHHFSMDLYFESAAMILTLITLGKYMESRAKGKTSEAISKLIDLTPKTAVVVRDGKHIVIPVEDVAVEDILVIKAGETVPVDGVVTDGSGTVDESALTGESVPVEKQTGDRLIGASISRSGYLEMKATKVGDDTALAQIIRLVEEASSSKAPIAKMADKVSGIFVPVVIGIAFLAFVIWMLLGYGLEFSMSIGISVLVISCPCALGLATPTAIMVGTGKGAENGILIKSAEALETAHSISTVVLDKTGTITQGKPVLTDIIYTNGIEKSRFLELAASLENKSEHPLAQAVVSYAKEQEIEFLDVSEFGQIPGRGIYGKIDGKEYFAGNERMLEERGIIFSDFTVKGKAFAAEGKTPLYFGIENTLLGIVAVADVVKPTSKQAVAELNHLGIDVVMLTGDNRITAQAIQNQVGINKVVAEVLPEDKEKEIRLLQESGHTVAMVGDGINDAPALARADVGIAIGAGTDVAIESADIVLMKNDLLDVVTSIQLSHAVIRNIRQNLFWAFFYNTVGIPIAAGVFFILWGLKLNPMLGAAAMSLSSVCVVSNALRLKLFRPKRLQQQETSVAEDNILNETVLQKVIVEKEKGELMMKKVMNVEGMMCSHCASTVEKALKNLDGVDVVSVNLESKTVTVSLVKEISDQELSQAVTDAGYEVRGIDLETKLS